MSYHLPAAVAQATARAVQARGWRLGTSEENPVAHVLSRLGCRPGEWQQQYRVGRYRLDFAAPEVKLDLEVDGHHFTPEGALRDALRDSWLRGQGWTIIRVDFRYGSDALADNLVNVVRFARSMVPVPRPAIGSRRRA